MIRSKGRHLAKGEISSINGILTMFYITRFIERVDPGEKNLRQSESGGHCSQLACSYMYGMHERLSQTRTANWSYN